VGVSEGLIRISRLSPSPVRLVVSVAIAVNQQGLFRMPDIISIKLDTKGLSPKALRVLETAVSIALRNRHVQQHHVPVADFCVQADLPNTTSLLQLRKLVSEVGGAGGSIDVIELDASDKDEDGGSWPVFKEVWVSSSHISFELTRYMYPGEAQTRLLGPSPNHPSHPGEAEARIGADPARIGHR